MLKKLPRPLFVVYHYSYPILAAIVVLIAFVLLNTDGLSLLELVILAVVIGLFVLVWWLFRTRQRKDTPVNATALLRAVKHSHKPALLVFESEFCVTSMLLKRQGAFLERMRPRPLEVYRISVNREPGRTLFKQYDGRITPTYLLIDPQGNVIVRSALVLRKDSVMYNTTRQQQAT
jgi:thioredoxin-related protein